MKKFFLICFVYIFAAGLAFAEPDIEALYNNAEPFSSKLYNDVDPFEDEDALKYAWSPYPLFRSSANLYFKDLTIEPGYYILTPRTLKGKDYVLFKQSGNVVFIIPSAKTEKTPLNFYQANTPQPRKTKLQKFATNIRDKFYEISGDSMRATPPKSYVNVDAGVTFITVLLYYGENKYTLIFKRTPY